MKICYVITALGYGGAERLLLNTTEILVKNHQLFIIYLKDEDELRDQFNQQIQFFRVPLGLSCWKNLRSLFKKINPDVIHTHLGHADILVP